MFSSHYSIDTELSDIHSQHVVESLHKQTSVHRIGWKGRKGKKIGKNAKFFRVNIPSYVVSDCEGVDEQVNNLEACRAELYFHFLALCCHFYEASLF